MLPDRPKQQRDPETTSFVLILICSKGKQKQILWRIHRMTEQFHVSLFGNGSFITGDRHSPFANVKCSDRCPSIRARIVKSAIAHPIGMQVFTFEFIAIGGKRKLTRQSMSVQHQTSTRDL